MNCKWIRLSSDYKLNHPNKVFEKSVNMPNRIIDRKDARASCIPSSICKCTNTNEYQCSSNELGIENFLESNLL